MPGLQLWSDTLVMIRDYLFLGGGFGTYNDVYPYYKKQLKAILFSSMPIMITWSYLQMGELLGLLSEVGSAFPFWPMG